MDALAIGLVPVHGRGAAPSDVGAKDVAVIRLIGDQGVHGWGECQQVRGSNNVGALARCEMEGDRPAEKIGQGVDLRLRAAPET